MYVFSFLIQTSFRSLPGIRRRVQGRKRRSNQVGKSEGETLEIWRFPEMGVPGTPSHHPFLHGIFHKIKTIHFGAPSIWPSIWRKPPYWTIIYGKFVGWCFLFWYLGKFKAAKQDYDTLVKFCDSNNKRVPNNVLCSFYTSENQL